MTPGLKLRDRRPDELDDTGVHGVSNAGDKPRYPTRDECMAALASATPRTLCCGQHLFWTGDPVTELWAVQRGSLKTYQLSSDGDERVSGFFFAGDIVGWDALACGSFRASAVALEPTTVTSTPATAVLDAALKSMQRQAQLLDGIRAEFVRLETRLWLDQCTANERLARFLLWLLKCQRPGSAEQFITLPMSRIDIASYLGLRIETVSRRLALFHNNGWIRLERRSIWIEDEQRLLQISSSHSEP